MGSLITRAKLCIPALPTEHIPRAHLLSKLEAGREKKLCLVIAGAGYGKTTLLAEWVRQYEQVVWYSLDEVDCDPAVFFAYLLAGLRERWPDLGRSIESTLNRPVPPDPERLTLALISELESSLNLQPLLIVFDDYHRLQDTPAIDTVMSLVLERLPAGVHIAVSSRTPVKFLTARLRAAGQLYELTHLDLRFNTDETRRLFLSLDSMPGVVQQSVNRAEGWVAGLSLIRQALAQQSHIDLEAFFKDPTSPSDHIYRFLAEEVLERLPEPLQGFLLQTGILESFSPADSDAIFGRADSAEWLAFLVNHGLFTVQLQRDPDVYRYHHLLADYLRDKLRQEAQAHNWHRQAAIYYAERQRWDEAFSHALGARDELLAAEIIVRGSRTMRLSGRLDTIQGWLNRLSPDTFMAFPRLYAEQGHLWEDRGRHEQASAAFRQAIALAEPRGDRPALHRAWAGLGIVHLRLGDLDSSRQAWEKAVEYSEEAEPQDRLTALNGLAMNLMHRGQNRRAHELFLQCLDLAALIGKPTQAQIMNNVGYALSQIGRLSEALRWFQDSLQLRREANLAPGILSCLNNIGLTLTMLGDLDGAQSSLDEAIGLGGEGPHPAILAHLLSSRGDVYAAKGDFVEAERRYRRSIEIMEPLQDVDGLAHNWMQLSELYRRQGDVVEAVRCADRAVERGEGAVDVNEWLPAQTTLAAAWLAQGNVEAANSLLTRVAQAHRDTTDNHYELTRVLWYLACAQHALSQSCREILAEALALAERWNYRFLITTLAREHPDLLAEAVAADLQPALVTNIVAALGEAVVPEVARLLDSRDSFVRVRAIERLAALGIEGVWKPLYWATRDHNPQVKQAAQAALFTLQRRPPLPLFVTTLGRFTLRRGDQFISDSAWVNRKALALFKYLLARAGKPEQREALMGALWPQLSQEWGKRNIEEKKQESARRNLNQAAFTLRRVLEPYLPPRCDSRYLISEGETYCLELPPGSWVDDHAFEGSIRPAQQARRRGEIEAALTHYQEAVDLYQGDYLVEDIYEDWSARRRESLRGSAIEALQALAGLYLDRSELDHTIEAAGRLVALDPDNEEGYELLMRAYLALGQSEQALRVYRRYEAHCKELGVLPSPRIRALYEQIRAQN